MLDLLNVDPIYQDKRNLTRSEDMKSITDTNVNSCITTQVRICFLVSSTENV